MTREEAIAYFTPHVLTKGPVMLDPEKMREAVAVLGEAKEPDPYIAGLELTEQICFDKLKKERDAYREALRPFAEEASHHDRPEGWQGKSSGDDAGFISEGICVGDLRRARTLLSQSSEGE